MTALHWAAGFLGKPWQVGAAGPDAFDCWGLVRAVYAARAGIDLPPAGFDSEDVRVVLRQFRDHPERRRWRTVETPAELDAVLLSQARQPVHVGVWVDVDGGRLLHAMRAGGVIAQRLADVRASGFQVLGFYRHETHA